MKNTRKPYEALTEQVFTRLPHLFMARARRAPDVAAHHGIRL
jgi:hypothetical protein